MKTIPYSIPQWGILAAACFAMLVYFFLHAWVAEDAYITFRVLDNFMNGYGLRWNVGERVQAYTHPLWMLLHIPVFYVWRNLFEVTLAISLACSMGAILFSLATVRKSLAVTLICFLLPLCISRSFLDYTSSGLENPLNYLLFAAFGFILIKKTEHRFFWFMTSLTIALAMLTRLDTTILYSPIGVYLLLAPPQPIRWRQIAAGALPLVLWFSFSLFYYGFLFPNTKYAKLDTGLDLSLYIIHGLRYAQQLLVKDSLGFIVLLSSVCFIFPFANIGHTLRKLPLAMALGVWLWCAYVIYIGGDYMIGRFWALPIFVTLWLWHLVLPPRLRPDIIFALAVFVATLMMIPYMMSLMAQTCGRCLPPKERTIDAYHSFYSNKLVGNIYPLVLRSKGDYSFSDGGIKLSGLESPPPQVMFFIGMAGFYAGPKVTIIDELALADPLLARLPAKKETFYIGHFKRAVPQGYSDALANGDLDEMDPSLAKYYEKLRLIISGNLFDPERLKTIALFNLGYYDHWKNDYLDHP